MSENPRVVILGGGGGASVAGAALANYRPEAQLFIANPVSDSGGSSGYFAHEFNLVPVGDPRANLEATSINPAVGRLLGKRFGANDTVEDVARLGDALAIAAGQYGLDEHLARQGRDITLEMAKNMDSLKGHPLGNIMLAGYAILEYGGSVVESSRTVGDIVGARARVMPIADQRLQLNMNDSGRIIEGEAAIDDHEVQDAHGAFITLKSLHGKPVHIHPEAAEAIENAGLVIIPPGSKHTTTAAILSVPGVKEALFAQSEAGGKVVAIANLVEDRATRGNCVGTLVNSIHSYMGGRTLDAVFYNTNTAPSVLPPGSIPIAHNPDYLRLLNVQAIGANLVGGRPDHDPNDAIVAVRSSIEHDGKAVASVIRDYMHTFVESPQNGRELIRA